MKKTEQKSRHTSETFVAEMMREWLFKNRWGYRFRKVELHQHGVDIRVQNDHSPHTRYFYIEAKGASSARYASSVDDGSVITSLGQIITRMSHGFAPNRYGIAIPESAMKIMARKLPWQVAKKLLLYVFSVDKKGRVTRYSWKDLKKMQDS
jgi:hypothetical protein